MVMTQIPDISYEINGDNITLKQGEVEPCLITLHRIHLQLVAEQSGLIEDQQQLKEEARRCDRIENALQDLYSGANWLLNELERHPVFPPSGDDPDDVIQARWVVDQIKHVCSLANVEFEPIDESQLSPKTQQIPVQQSII